VTYTLASWQDSPATTTPLSSANLLLYNSAINDIDSRINAKQAAMTVTAVKNSAYTATANQFVPVDTTTIPVTITFPAAPVNGTLVGAKQVVRGGSNTVTLQLSGSDKFNTTTGPTTATLTVLNQGALYQYNSSTAVWISVAESGGGGVSSVAAGDSTITVGGTTTNPTVAVNAIAESKVTNLTTDLAAKAPLASPTFTGTATFTGAIVEQPDTLTDATTIAVDASLGTHVRVTLAGNRTMGAPSSPVDGQRLLFEIIQDATGSRTVNWTTAAVYAFGTDVPSPTLTTTANKRDFIGFIYTASTNKWYCIAVARGY
jgi:hypothetical protein